MNIQRCETCHGLGEVLSGHCGGMWGPVWRVCPVCVGAGKKKGDGPNDSGARSGIVARTDEPAGCVLCGDTFPERSMSNFGAGWVCPPCLWDGKADHLLRRADADADREQPAPTVDGALLVPVNAGAGQAA